MLQTDRQVEGVVRVLAVQSIRVEVGVLGLRPTALAGVQITKREVQIRRVRFALQGGLDDALTLDGVEVLLQGDERRLRQAVAWIQPKQSQIDLGGRAPTFRLNGDSAQPQPRIPVSGILGQHPPIRRFGAGEVTVSIRFIGACQQRNRRSRRTAPRRDGDRLATHTPRGRGTAARQARWQTRHRSSSPCPPAGAGAGLRRDVGLLRGLG